MTESTTAVDLPQARQFPSQSRRRRGSGTFLRANRARNRRTDSASASLIPKCNDGEGDPHTRAR
jgi:hypothetical protein